MQLCPSRIPSWDLTLAMIMTFGLTSKGYETDYESRMLLPVEACSPPHFKSPRCAKKNSLAASIERSIAVTPNTCKGDLNHRVAAQDGATCG